MHTLVTGGAGFVGAALVERLLAEGHTVDVVDNLSTGSLWNLAEARAGAGRDLTFHQLDVRSSDVADLIARRRPEVVWHLAAQVDLGAGIGGPVADAEVNVVGALGVLEGVRAAGTRKLVVTSSAAVYGEGGPRPIGESHARRPLSPHGVAKHAVDAYLAVYASLESLRFTSLVLGTVYGPRTAAGVVATWAQCLAAGRPCTVFGDGSDVRDFVYVDDVVDALARAADRGDGMVLNVGTGEGTSLAELHPLMVEIAGRVMESTGGGVRGEARVSGEQADHAGEQAGASGGFGELPGPSGGLGELPGPSGGVGELAGVSGDEAGVAAEQAGEGARAEGAVAHGGEVGGGEAGDHHPGDLDSASVGRAEDGEVEVASGMRTAAPPERGPALGLRHAPARPGEPRSIVLNPARAAEVLEWCPWTTLADGLEAVIRAAVLAPRAR